MIMQRLAYYNNGVLEAKVTQPGLARVPSLAHLIPSEAKLGHSVLKSSSGLLTKILGHFIEFFQFFKGLYLPSLLLLKISYWNNIYRITFALLVFQI